MHTYHRLIRTSTILPKVPEPDAPILLLRPSLMHTYHRLIRTSTILPKVPEPDRRFQPSKTDPPRLPNAPPDPRHASLDRYTSTKTEFTPEPDLATREEKKWVARLTRGLCKLVLGVVFWGCDVVLCWGVRGRGFL
jgi:hypothetical protein